MVDKPKRLETAKAIEDFLACRITNFHYNDCYPRSTGDPASLAVLHDKNGHCLARLGGRMEKAVKTQKKASDFDPLTFLSSIEKGRRMVSFEKKATIFAAFVGPRNA